MKKNLKMSLPKVEINSKEYYFAEKQKLLINVEDNKDFIELTSEETKEYKQDLHDGILERFDKYRELANDIIDDVSEVIIEEYRIEPMERTDDGGNKVENPALLWGEKYYALEDDISERIKEMVMMRNIRFTHKELKHGKGQED